MNIEDEASVMSVKNLDEVVSDIRKIKFDGHLLNYVDKMLYKFRGYEFEGIKEIIVTGDYDTDDIDFRVRARHDDAPYVFIKVYDKCVLVWSDCE